jgi:hypothetical protein
MRISHLTRKTLTGASMPHTGLRVSTALLNHVEESGLRPAHITTIFPMAISHLTRKTPTGANMQL